MINFGSLYSNVTSISYGNISATKAYLGYIQVWPVTKAGSNILEYTSIIDLSQYYHWIYNKEGFPNFESAEAAEAVVSVNPSNYYQEPFDVSVDRTVVDSSIIPDSSRYIPIITNNDWRNPVFDGSLRLPLNPLANKKVGTTSETGYPGEDITVPNYMYTGTITFDGSPDILFGGNMWNILPYYITKLSLPSELTTISPYAFYLYGAEFIDIPESVTSIGEYAFSQAGYGPSDHPYMHSGLHVHIPNGVTIIPEHCFDQCYINSTSLSLPDSITDVSAYAFNCGDIQSDSSILTITMPANLQRIGISAFDIGSNQIIRIPECA